MKFIGWGLLLVPLFFGVLYLALSRDSERPRDFPSRIRGPVAQTASALEEVPVAPLLPPFVARFSGEIQQELAHLTQSQDERVRAWAALLQSVRDDEKAFSKILKIARFADEPRVRRFMALLLGEVSDGTERMVLAEYLRDAQDADLRLVAAQALARKGAPLLETARTECDPRAASVAVGTLDATLLEELIADVDACRVGRSLGLRRLAALDPARAEACYPHLDVELRRVALESLLETPGFLRRLGSLEMDAALRAHAVNEAFRRKVSGLREWLELISTSDASEMVRQEALRTLEKCREDRP